MNSILKVVFINLYDCKEKTFFQSAEKISFQFFRGESQGDCPHSIVHHYLAKCSGRIWVHFRR